MKLVFNILAAWRILRFIQVDKLTYNLRRKSYEKLKNSRVKKLSNLLNCPWCLSVWIAASVILLDRNWNGWQITAEILAVASVVGFLGWLDQEHIG